MADRAVSEVLSFALVFSLIIISITLVSVSGLNTLQNARDVEQVENAERAFDILADNTADIYERGGPSRATEINLGESQLQTGDNVTIVVHVNESIDSDPLSKQSWQIRPLIYDGADDRRVIYIAGAIFRTNRDGGVVIRNPPMISHRDAALVQVVGINRPTVQSYGGSTVLVRMNHRGSNVTYQNRTGDPEQIEVKIANTPRADLWELALGRRGFDCAPINATATSCEITTVPDRVYVVYHDIRVNIDQ